MAPFDPSELGSTPYGAPLVPSLPIRLRRTEILTVVYRCPAEALDRFVPEPLAVADELCVLHVYWMHDAEWFGVYGESAFQIPVRLPDGSRSVYSPFLVLGSDGAVAAGRELYGQPKKQGEIELAPNGDLLVGRVSSERDRHRDRDDVLQADARRARTRSSSSCPGRRTTSI